MRAEDLAEFVLVIGTAWRLGGATVMAYLAEARSARRSCRRSGVCGIVAAKIADGAPQRH
jgi:hypothetical protein